MKRMYRITAAISILFTVAPVFSATSYAYPAAVTYRTYHNQGWGYSIAVPGSWHEGSRAGNGDGRAFYAPSGDSQFYNGQYGNPPAHDVMVNAFGMNNVAPPFPAVYSAAKLLPILRSDLATSKKKGDIQSYAIGIEHGWVVSTQYLNVGRGGEEVWRQYSTTGNHNSLPGITEDFVIVVPKAHFGEYRAVIQHMLSSIRPHSPYQLVNSSTLFHVQSGGHGYLMRAKFNSAVFPQSYINILETPYGTVWNSVPAGLRPMRYQDLFYGEMFHKPLQPVSLYLTPNDAFSLQPSDSVRLYTLPLSVKGCTEPWYTFLGHLYRTESWIVLKVFFTGEGMNQPPQYELLAVNLSNRKQEKIASYHELGGTFFSFSLHGSMVYTKNVTPGAGTAMVTTWQSYDLNTGTLTKLSKSPKDTGWIWIEG